MRTGRRKEPRATDGALVAWAARIAAIDAALGEEAARLDESSLDVARRARVPKLLLKHLGIRGPDDLAQGRRRLAEALAEHLIHYAPSAMARLTPAERQEWRAWRIYGRRRLDRAAAALRRYARTIVAARRAAGLAAIERRFARMAERRAELARRVTAARAKGIPALAAKARVAMSGPAMNFAMLASLNRDLAAASA